ncbi:MAG: PEP-utilizing enzyme [Patescibacteria group bacterium]
MWSKYITRRLAVQVAQSWNFAWGEAMRQVYGVSVQDTLVFRDQRKTEYYVDDKQYQRYIRELYRLLSRPDFVKNFHRQAESKLASILKNVQRRFDLDFGGLSNAELLSLYRDFTLPQVEQFYIRMWTVFNIAEPLTAVVRAELVDRLKDERCVDEFLLKLASPLRPNDVLHKQIDILSLAARRRSLSARQLAAGIMKLVAKYRHIPMFDFDHEPYGRDHFRQELQSVKRPAQKLLAIKRLLASHRREAAAIIKILKPDRKLRQLLKFLQDNVFLRDHRDMLRQKLNLELQKLYQEIADRLGLKLEQVATLTNQEIIYHLKTVKHFPRVEAVRRGRAYLLVQKGRRAQIYSGRQALAKFRQELAPNRQTASRELRGIAASPGRATGPARVIYTNRDLSKVRTGDILVAAMTRQDFVPAMGRAKAIIIDEGGIICHAAIIARELHKPCVVALKTATHFIQDGDRVEVDADRGIVKILSHI